MTQKTVLEMNDVPQVHYHPQILQSFTETRECHNGSLPMLVFFQSSASDMQEAVQETEEVCLSFVSGT